MSYLMTFLRNKVEGDYNSILNKIPNNLPDFI